MMASSQNASLSVRVAVVGAGPAGLMAADVLSAQGVGVDVFDAMPSVGRKFLLAGKGGLNLTHSEPMPGFAERYRPRPDDVVPWLSRFGPQAVRDWAHGLGQETFVGTSGRVFPVSMKAAPLLRAWLHRLRSAGVRFHMRHRWTGGWQTEADGHRLCFDGPEGEVTVHAEALVLALGGASWPRLGSDGAWVPWLAGKGIRVEALRAANCGFDVARLQPDGKLSPGWSDHLRSRHAGQPLKSVALTVQTEGEPFHQPGEFIITESGIEGSLVYAASSLLRQEIERAGHARLTVDLLPERSAEWVAAELAHSKGPRSLSTHLKSRLGLHGVKAALLYELVPKADMGDARALATWIKALPLHLVSTRPLAEAISTAGGVGFESLDEGLMLRDSPGVCCIGEMLDWEAPTGGYLLTACLASGVVAAEALLARMPSLQRR
jgi:uncharacterized flavoprotein (TIGR03862 family)